MQNSGITSIGEVEWRVLDDNGKILQAGHKSNVVTQLSGILIAMRMKGDGNPIKGLAIGKGTQTANDAVHQLNSYYRYTALHEIVYMNGSDPVTNDSQTNKLKCKFQFDASGMATNTKITEMGLIGNQAITTNQPNWATSGVDISAKSVLMNYVTFPAVNVPASGMLEWDWILTF